MRILLGALTVVASPLVRDGQQVWLKGAEVVNVTTNDTAKFWAMFGLMQVPSPEANRVMLSIADYDALKAAAQPTP